MSHRRETKISGTTNPTKVIAVILLMIGLEVAAKSSTRVESFRTCAKRNVNVGNFQCNLTVHKTKNSGLIEGDVHILKTMKPPLPADISISRCRNSAGKECVSLLKYKHNNVCPFFVSGSLNTNTLWRDFVGKFSPSLECPVKQGVYKVLNGTFEDDKFSTYFQAVPGEHSKVSYFVVKVHSKINDEEMMCVEITFRLVRA